MIWALQTINHMLKFKSKADIILFKKMFLLNLFLLHGKIKKNTI